MVRSTVSASRKHADKKSIINFSPKTAEIHKLIILSDTEPSHTAHIQQPIRVMGVTAELADE